MQLSTFFHFFHFIINCYKGFHLREKIGTYKDDERNVESFRTSLQMRVTFSICSIFFFTNVKLNKLLKNAGINFVGARLFNNNYKQYFLADN